MKPIKFLIPVILSVLCVQASCEKNDENPNPDSLIGKWKYIGYYGGFAGWLPYDGPLIYIKFSKDSIFTKVEDEKTVMQTKFYVKEGKYVEGVGKWDTIRYKQSDDEFPPYEVFNLQGDTLKLMLADNYPGDDPPSHFNQIKYYKQIK
jgi:hypothetical protein